MAQVKRNRSPLDWNVLVEDDQDLLRILKMREALQEVLEAVRYLNMDLLREHKKEQLRRIEAAA